MNPNPLYEVNTIDRCVHVMYAVLVFILSLKQIYVH